MSVTNRADKGCEPGDMGDHVTVRVDKRWLYNVNFEDLPAVVRVIDAKGAGWILEGAWPHEARVSIAVSVELELDVCRPGDGL